MINDKDINISEKPIAEEKAQASQEPPKQKTPQQEPQQQEAPQASLKEVIAKQAIEEEASGSSSFTLRKILGGDILTAQIIRRQIWLVILIVFFVIIYISNRYNIQNDIIELDKLQKELQDTNFLFRHVFAQNRLCAQFQCLWNKLVTVNLRSLHGNEEMTFLNLARVDVYSRNLYISIADYLNRLDVFE
jgi:hypothetical protein